ncbi:MAG: type I restriction enzyme endonuclease domain-containing protein [Candidatus Methanoperedens sp.]
MTKQLLFECTIRCTNKRIVKEGLDKKFKDSDDPLRIVFVCAMWMTGFDVPSCSTIYLDKPMRNHTLMQTIARANRVFGDKLNGLIVELKNIILETTAFCTERGIAISKIQAVYGFERVKLIDDAIDAILTSDESKVKYLSMAANVVRIYRAILSDPAANEFGQMQMLFAIIAEKIRSLALETDITQVMNSVENLLDESIATEGYVIRESSDEYRLVDLSQIDFEALKAKFEKSHKSYLEKFQKLIDDYNSGSYNVETFFKKLMEYAQGLSAEEKRGISENLSEEELAIFDLLIKPEMTLSKKEEQEVKKVAHDLLEILKQGKLVLDWRKRQQSRAAVLQSIEIILDQELPRTYTKELFQHKCDVVYQHIYDSYFGQGLSIYAHAV